MRVLGVFAKQPTAGAVKTRLAAETSVERACAIAGAMLADTLDRMSAVQAHRVIAYAPIEAGAWFESAAARRFDLAPQGDGDLGDRLRQFLDTRREQGPDATVVIGTDSPTLPVEFVEQAFAILGSADVVIGPATDGGYYLIGCRTRIPPIFDGIAWSSAGVLAQTMAKLDDPKWRVALLPPWYDIDTLADWRMLCGHIAALRRAGIDPAVPHTEALI